MNISEMYPSKYIKSEDLQGQRVILTVMSVTIEEVADKEHKPVMRFVGRDKGMVLNKTNALLCASVWGDDTLTWSGQKLELFAQPVNFQGKIVQGLAVLPYSATGTHPTQPNSIPGHDKEDGPINAAPVGTAQPAYPDGLGDIESQNKANKAQQVQELEELVQDIERADAELHQPLKF